MSKGIRPLARKEGLVVQPVDGETVVYDSTTDAAYVLSPAATAVWQACDGTRTVKDLTQVLSPDTPKREQVVWFTLGQLNGLLEEQVTLPPELVGTSRRQFLIKSGLVAAAVTIPLVTRMVTPTPARAQSANGFCCDCGGSIVPTSSCSECPSICNGTGFDECFPAPCEI
jgi:hypothetical protein